MSLSSLLGRICTRDFAEDAYVDFGEYDLGE